MALGVHDGSIFAAEQSACNPALKGANRVSVIHFVTMGPETIVARRVQPSLLEISFNRDIVLPTPKSLGVRSGFHAEGSATRRKSGPAAQRSGTVLRSGPAGLALLRPRP